MEDETTYRLTPRTKPDAAALRAALAASPHLQLVPQYYAGRARVAVYLLRAPHGACVAPPAAQAADVVTCNARLLTWLRQAGRWCSREEALRAVPPPAGRLVEAFLKARLQELLDDVGSSSCFGFLAARRDGQPPGPPPCAQAVSLAAVSSALVTSQQQAPAHGGGSAA